MLLTCNVWNNCILDNSSLKWNLNWLDKKRRVKLDEIKIIYELICCKFDWIIIVAGKLQKCSQIDEIENRGFKTTFTNANLLLLKLNWRGLQYKNLTSSTALFVYVIPVFNFSFYFSNKPTNERNQSSLKSHLLYFKQMPLFNFNTISLRVW